MTKHFKFLLPCIFFLSLITAYGQAVDENLVKVADEMYNFGGKKDALNVYLQAVEVNPNNARANYMAGKCYIETIQKELSVDFFLKAYQLDPNIAPDILFKIGNGYQLGAKFQDAIKYFNMYAEKITEEKAKQLGSAIKDEVIKAKRKIYECMNGDNYYSNLLHYKIENIKDVVNSEYPDYAPAITADQTLMIFTSRREGGVGRNKDVDNEFFEDIWFTHKIDGKWTTPKNMGKPINSETHDASIGLSPDGTELFIYKPDNGGDIYVCKQKKDGTWSEAVNMGKIVNSRYNEPSVSISIDDKTLYFSSDRPGGFGGLDIYKSELDAKGNWSKAVNLGSTINTEYDDDSPYIDIDSKTLYFSSRGHKGMGGYDIYKAVFDENKRTWGAPENMGYPVNSPDDDIYFVIAGDGKTGYYASAKGDGYGDKDIYKIYLRPDEEPKKDTAKPAPLEVKKDTIAKKDTVIAPTPVVTTEEPKITPTPIIIEKPKPEKKEIKSYPTIIKGIITDYNSGDPLTARIVINDLKGNVLSVLDVAEDGTFKTEISQSKPAKYSVTVTKDGYIYANVNIPVPADAKIQKTITRDLSLKKISKGEIFILRNIYYDFDKAVIKEQSFPFLDKLVAWLKSHPTVHLEIGGHTDNLGMEQYNKILSQKRVNSVMLYLTAKGIDPQRLTAIGFGEERPLATNDDEMEGREINRRTEFRIMKE